MSDDLTSSPLFVEEWPINQPIPYARNARKIPQSAIDKVAASIHEFGFRQPIVVDKQRVILAGHTRLLAAQKLGLEHVPVHVAMNLTVAQAKAFRLADNRTNQESVWDNDLLALELADLKVDDFDLEFTGFDAGELIAIDTAANSTAEGLTEDDAVPEPPKDPITVLGDLWILGNHRLLCGDSTSIDAVERLMDGKKAGLMNTDPPYGVSYANEARPNPGVAKPRVAKPRVANDEFRDDELRQFLEAVFSTAITALKADAAWYLWHAHLTQGFFAAAAAAAHVILHRQIIWVKPVLLLGRGQYHWKHEPCYMGWVQGHQPPDYGSGKGERNQTTVWEIASVTQAERKEFNHATPKPVALFDIPIVKHLKHGEICYEPFAGSGPQIIAAEKNATRCFAMELDPQYCDVIVNRWQGFTGNNAVLEANGRTFNDLANERQPNAPKPEVKQPSEKKAS